MQRLATNPVSELYLARQEPLGRPVWIRSLRSDVPATSALADSLRREAASLCQVAHPALPIVLDLVERPPRLWVVLEAIEGTPLSEVLAGGRSLSPLGVVAVGLQLADCLATIHDHGLIHSALRPDSVYLGPTGAVRITGMHNARPLSPLEPADGEDSSAGFEAPRYMSPEQLAGESLDERTDLFALGAVLYECLTGKEAQPVQEGAPLPSTLAPSPRSPEAPAQLARLVDRCLRESPGERPSTAHEVLGLLRDMAGPAVRADPHVAVASDLEELGLASEENPRAARALRVETAQRAQARVGLRRSMLALLTACGLWAVSGALLSHWLEAGAPAVTEARMALAPGSREPYGELLVVAEPWAHVFVDGQHLETTPFARPLRLSPGVHHLRLEHPSAPTRRQRVELKAGQRELVSVQLAVRGPIVDAGIVPRPTWDAGAPWGAPPERPSR